jgi:hypothetical protein
MPTSNGAGAPGGWTTAERLARELQDIEAAIELVRTGAASSVTLSGLRFTEAVLAQLGAQVQREGIALDPLYWPEDAGCDVTVRRIDVDA